MRDKHLHCTQDSELLKLIYREVNTQLIIDKKAFRRAIWLKFACYFPLMILSYCSLYYWAHPVTSYVVYGMISLLFAFNFSHDCSHNTIFRSKRKNNLVFTLIYTLVGAHAEAWKQRHVGSHHYAPNVEEYDSDLRISSLIRVIPHSRHRWYHRFQHVYAPFLYTTYSLFWVFIKDIVILFSEDMHKGFRYHLSFWLQKSFYIGYLLVLPMLLAPVPWYMVLTGFLVMHFSQSLFLLFTFFMTHHVESTAYPVTNAEGYINTSWLMNQVKSSNDMHPFSPVANFILGGFNNHIAHHLFPNIHHIHYPRLNRILYATLRAHGIEPNQTTYAGGIRSHLRLLHRMSFYHT